MSIVLTIGEGEKKEGADRNIVTYSNPPPSAVGARAQFPNQRGLLSLLS